MTTGDQSNSQKRPVFFSDQDILELFRELPGHRGCAESDIRDAETRLQVTLPAVYKDWMQLDDNRLVMARIVAPIRKLVQRRNDATELLIDDGHSFRLKPNEVVFAWEDIFAFYFFHAAGEHDPPVMMFNYYSSNDGWAPKIAYPTLTAFLVEKLRRYLRLM